MQGFNIGKYLLRVVKYIVFYAVIIFLMLVVVYFTSSQQDISFWELIRPGQQTNLIILIIAFLLFTLLLVLPNRKYTQTGLLTRIRSLSSGFSRKRVL